MGDMNISSAEASDLTGAMTDYSVNAQDTDGPTDSKETYYINAMWTKQLGYYKTIPELKAAIDAKSRWTIGKGFSSPWEPTEMVLGSLIGFGKDTFNTILENADKVAQIGGDSFGEIIRDTNDFLINVKPLNPGKIRIVSNRKGLIIRYEQMTVATDGKPKVGKSFQPHEILHFSRDRVADEIHGVSIVDSVEWIILARNEAMADMKELMHRHVKPRNIFYLDTDDTTKIAAFKAKADAACGAGENLYIPKGAVEHDLLSVPPNSTLSPIPWIEKLNQYFFQATGVPNIVVGGSGEISESASKVAVMAYEQLVAEGQLYIEEQILAQLNLEIELHRPVSIQNEMMTDMTKQESLQASTPEDTSITNTQMTPGVPA